MTFLRGFDKKDLSGLGKPERNSFKLYSYLRKGQRNNKHSYENWEGFFVAAPVYIYIGMEIP